MCILEQSVWFENMAVDKNDNPQYDIVYTDNIPTWAHQPNQQYLYKALPLIHKTKIDLKI